jgi:hypothetical protein
VDALGRDVYVDARQCLDISGLALNAVWQDLERVPGASSSARRRAYVVLRYEACQSQPVPAIAPPCNEPGDATAYSRVLDRFRIDLAATPPADPHMLVREWLWALLSADPKRSPRDVLLDFIVGKLDGELDAEPPALAQFFRGAVDAPLLLATVDLELDDANCKDKPLVQVVDEPENQVRALLPSAQAIADSLFGVRLSGPAPGPGPYPFQASGWSLSCGNMLHVRMTKKPHEGALKGLVGHDGEGDKEVNADAGRRGPKPNKPWKKEPSFSLQRLVPSGWEPLVLERPPYWDAATCEIVFDVQEAYLESVAKPFTFHLWIAGEAGSPLVAEDGSPLMGLVGDPITHPFRGRDVSILGTWYWKR